MPHLSMKWVRQKQDNEAVDDDRGGDGEELNSYEDGDLAGGKDSQKGCNFWIQTRRKENCCI